MKKTRVELHLIQSFAPSCLNRDDTNTPKDCEFGGVRRARISSQCLKRAVRTAFKEDGLIDEADLSVRTRRLLDELATHLVGAKKVERAVAEGVARAAIKAAGLELKEEKDKTKPKKKTQYLLFLARTQIEELKALVLEHWDAFAALVPPPPPPAPAEAPVAPMTAEQKRAAAEAKRQAAAEAKAAKKKAKKEATKQLEKDLQNELEGIFAAGANAPELALFGRMVADKPIWNVEAACQVAHALSTHRVSVEFDYFTAVDDLKDPKDPEDEEGAGAGMIGTVAFNAACFYRYSVVDTAALSEHLREPKVTRDALESFLKASVLAIPTGKQNSMAAHNPPSFILAVVRDDQPCSLANAFVDPVRPKGGARGDLVTQSILALDRHVGALVRAYGDEGIKALEWVAVDEDLKAPYLDGKAKRHERVAELVSAVLEHALPETKA